MNRSAAKKIAETITNEQLQQMLENAKANIKDWNVVSSVNKGLSKGISWNILGKGFDVKKCHHILVKTNMVREFGSYLPTELKPSKVVKSNKSGKFSHQEPIFE